MNRRTFVVTGALAGATALGGCLGRNDDRFTLSIVDTSFVENDAGYLEVKLTVTNVGNEHQTGTVYVHGDLDGDRIVRTRNVSLPAHQTREYAITYDVAYEDVSNFSIETELEPATS
ncbi:twin-arginine translocation signal domain-containing protein [Halanaeroarchaeum sulfurireducens]|uniref:CARDB domain-containing protein n=1 Tax=Halanaeroarchaeum sulfurireducens TaxID=1604004 RepID=A0A0F7P921_9EURY|nr:twin-arginine translocation signal domain-containing protein [Halanaeroarchaeum sulfurireducens]AKH97252.1 hypothetical protein HLASF_0756 [Halanaeroarchaeum sulfurireducens]ALG81654.1 hypothetical protein HLASA_0753 [Halanaeroarchaeum sulfurireducens]